MVSTLLNYSSKSFTVDIYVTVSVAKMAKKNFQMSIEKLTFQPSWFVAPFQRLAALVASCSSIGFCNITADLI